jgi:hypothetical protein
MNLNLVTTEVSGALGDPTNAIYSTTFVQQSIIRALRVCSQYFPCPRSMGVAALVTACAAGQGTVDDPLLMTGGLLSGAEELTLDYGAAYGTPETVTIASITPEDDETQPTGYVSVVLASPTVYAHSAGALVMPNISTPNGLIGLNVVAGQSRYQLPLDFISVDKSSFDLAVGAKCTYRKENGYYDATYIYMNQLSGTGFGRSMSFGPSQYGTYPIAGDPFDNPNSAIPPGSFLYRFYTGDTPNLRIAPTPQTNCTLDFDYNGAHTVQSWPASSQELIVLYARYVALSMRANVVPESVGGVDVTAEKYGVKASANTKALLDLAQDAYKLWEDKTRFVPYGTSG